MNSYFTNHMNIKIDLERESIFNGLILREHVNELTLHELINSDLLKQVPSKLLEKKYDNEHKLLKCYRQMIKDDYTYTLYFKTEVGRCVSKDGLSLLGLRKAIRQTITNNLMVGIDIENCHPVLMVQMLKKYGFKCDYLNDYVSNRNKWFTMVKDHWKIEDIMNEKDARDCAKTLFIRIMYGGGYKKWIEEFKLPTLEGKIPNKLQGFINEFNEIKNLFMLLNPELTEKIRTKKTNNNDSYMNIAGSVTSSIMQEVEGIVLEFMYSYLVKRCNTDVISLCCDGLMICKEKYNDQLLKELEVYVFLQTGFIICVTEKKFDLIYNDLDDHVINKDVFTPNQDYRAIDEIINRLNILYDDFKESSYYHDDSMTVIKKKKNDVIIKCSSIKCVLCKVSHISGEATLKINKCGNFEFCCHGNKKIFQKSDKGLKHIRNIQTEIIDYNIKEFFELNTTDINVIYEESRFIGCDDDNNVILRKEYNESKFLILNSHMEFNSFGSITNYLDVKDGKYDIDRLCIQVESLHKINNTKYDCVIIDEIETVLNQFSSSTMKHVRDCWHVMISCIDYCNWCVLADAFVLNRTLDFVRGVNNNDGSILMIHNTKPYLQGRKAIQISQDLYNEHLISNLKSNKRIVNLERSRDDLLNLERLIRTECSDKIIKVYDKDSDKNDFKNVNDVWSKCDFVGYTPVIQTGISYMDKPFDLCYANLKSSNLARDAMQMIMRCRKLDDDIVYFSMNKRQIYNTSNMFMFDDFKSFQDDRFNKTFLLIDTLKKDKIKNNSLIEMLEQSLKTTDE
eukprot:gene16009-21726_t